MFTSLMHCRSCALIPLVWLVKYGFYIYIGREHQEMMSYVLMIIVYSWCWYRTEWTGMLHNKLDFFFSIISLVQQVIWDVLMWLNPCFFLYRSRFSNTCHLCRRALYMQGFCRNMHNAKNNCWFHQCFKNGMHPL